MLPQQNGAQAHCLVESRTTEGALVDTQTWVVPGVDAPLQSVTAVSPPGARVLVVQAVVAGALTIGTTGAGSDVWAAVEALPGISLPDPSKGLFAALASGRFRGGSARSVVSVGVDRETGALHARLFTVDRAGSPPVASAAPSRLAGPGVDLDRYHFGDSRQDSLVPEWTVLPLAETLAATAVDTDGDGIDELGLVHVEDGGNLVAQVLGWHGAGLTRIAQTTLAVDPGEGLGGCVDLVGADLDGDGREELAVLSARWRKQPASPRDPTLVVSWSNRLDILGLTSGAGAPDLEWRASMNPLEVVHGGAALTVGTPSRQSRHSEPRGRVVAGAFSPAAAQGGFEELAVSWTDRQGQGAGLFAGWDGGQAGLRPLAPAGSIGFHFAGHRGRPLDHRFDAAVVAGDGAGATATLVLHAIGDPTAPGSLAGRQSAVRLESGGPVVSHREIQRPGNRPLPDTLGRFLLGWGGQRP